MRRNKRRANIVVPVASMGDIAFLLIIFFMVCSNFAREQYPLTPAHSPNVEKLKQSQIYVGIDRDGMLYFQGVQMCDADAVEHGVRALIGDKTTDEARTVIFRCDKGIDKKVFEPVLSAISKGGGIIAAVGDKRE